jgi:hypothetical protein
MHPDSQLAEFLRKAMEAEKEETLAIDAEARRAWERIAVGYLELAEILRKRDALYIGATI